jgi:hypothetical protein
MGRDKDTDKLDDQDEPREPKDPEKGEPQGDEGTDPSDEGPEKGEPEGGEPMDSHGQPGINREKYQRDMRAKDEQIAKLQAQLDEASKTEEGRAELQRQLDELKAKSADETVTWQLKDAGCRDENAIKAAKALLPDYEGDVAKLKGACPFLFPPDKKDTGSTGAKPQGASSAIDEKIDRVFSRK